MRVNSDDHVQMRADFILAVAGGRGGVAAVAQRGICQSATDIHAKRIHLAISLWQSSVAALTVLTKEMICVKGLNLPLDRR